MFTATNWKWHDFLRISVGGNVKPWAQGGKAMCHLPLSHPTTTLNVLLISWGSYCWQWSVVGLSLLAHMHTPLMLAGRPLCPLSPFFPHDCTLSRTAFFSLKNTRFPHAPVGLPHRQSSRRKRRSIPNAGRGFSLFWLTRQEEKWFLGCHYVFLLGVSSHMNLADGVGCMFFPYILGCYIFLLFLVDLCFPTFVGWVAFAIWDATCCCGIFLAMAQQRNIDK